MDMSLENLLSAMKGAGYKITKPRLFVLSFLLQSKNPLPVKLIAQKAKYQGINQATIYRILSSCKAIGLVNEINLRENRAYFELKDPQDHHHIICLKCKKVGDFKGCNHRKLMDKAINSNRDFVTITNHSFEFFGICKSCITNQ